MRKPLVIAGAAVAVSLAALGGAAFTGAGLTTETADTEFVGGTVSQNVTGATLKNIEYTWATANPQSNTTLSQITLTFQEELTEHAVTVDAHHGSDSTASFGCAVVDAEIDPLTWTCDAPEGVHGLHKVDVTVAKSGK